jgi:hypothetical protein
MPDFSFAVEVAIQALTLKESLIGSDEEWGE